MKNKYYNINRFNFIEKFATDPTTTATDPTTTTATEPTTTTPTTTTMENYIILTGGTHVNNITSGSKISVDMFFDPNIILNKNEHTITYKGTTYKIYYDNCQNQNENCRENTLKLSLSSSKLTEVNKILYLLNLNSSLILTTIVFNDSESVTTFYNNTDFKSVLKNNLTINIVSFINSAISELFNTIINNLPNNTTSLIFNNCNIYTILSSNYTLLPTKITSLSLPNNRIDLIVFENTIKHLSNLTKLNIVSNNIASLSYNKIAELLIEHPKLNDVYIGELNINTSAFYYVNNNNSLPFTFKKYNLYNSLKTPAEEISITTYKINYIINNINDIESLLDVPFTNTVRFRNNNLYYVGSQLNAVINITFDTGFLQTINSNKNLTIKFYDSPKPITTQYFVYDGLYYILTELSKKNIGIINITLIPYMLDTSTSPVRTILSTNTNQCNSDLSRFACDFTNFRFKCNDNSVPCIPPSSSTTIATTGRTIATTGRTIATTGGTIATTGRTIATTGGTIATTGGTIATTMTLKYKITENTTDKYVEIIFNSNIVTTDNIENIKINIKEYLNENAISYTNIEIDIISGFTTMNIPSKIIIKIYSEEDRSNIIKILQPEMLDNIINNSTKPPPKKTNIIAVIIIFIILLILLGITKLIK